MSRRVELSRRLEQLEISLKDMSLKLRDGVVFDVVFGMIQNESDKSKLALFSRSALLLLLVVMSFSEIVG